VNNNLIIGIDKDNQVINGIEIAPYQRHPRILELRLIMIYKSLTENYDANTASNLFKDLCDVFRLNWTLISGILNRNFEIRRLSKKNKKRYQQEVVFMGVLFNETRYYIAQQYLGIAVSSIYRNSMNLKPERFLSQEWLDELDEHVVICGNPNYRLEAEKFIEGLIHFLEALGRVSLPKT